MDFTGKISTRHDGENCSAEGTITLKGKRCEVLVNSNPHGAEFTLDGEDVEVGSKAHDYLDIYFLRIFSDAYEALVFDNFDAELVNGKFVKIEPFDDHLRPLLLVNGKFVKIEPFDD